MLTVPRAGRPWRVAAPAAKLLARGGLPGAFGFDLAAHSLHTARRAGVGLPDLLAAAIPSSWMVNSRATSPVFRRWLEPPLRDAWAELLALLDGGPERWLARPAAERDAAARAARALAIEGHGAAALSKVLALLAPETVPLMDDAAVAFALDALPAPRTPDDPKAGPELILPMLDWFAAAAIAAEPELARLARAYPLAPLGPEQVLDRLLWFESWGWRLFHQAANEPWWWLADGPREAIVRVDAAGAPGRDFNERLDLETIQATPWREAALAALASGLA